VSPETFVNALKADAQASGKLQAKAVLDDRMHATADAVMREIMETVAASIERGRNLSMQYLAKEGPLKELYLLDNVT